MTIEEEVKAKPELLRRLLELAVDACWSYIESASNNEIEDGIEWMDCGCDFDTRVDDIALLTEVGVLGVHPAHPRWVRKIATLLDARAQSSASGRKEKP